MVRTPTFIAMASIMAATATPVMPRERATPEAAICTGRSWSGLAARSMMKQARRVTAGQMSAKPNATPSAITKPTMGDLEGRR